MLFNVEMWRSGDVAKWRSGDVADLEALTFNLALMFIGNPNVQFSTEPAILPNCC